METSNIIIRAWDQKRNSVDIRFEDAWKIVVPLGPEPLMSMDYLKEWAGYSDVSITDSEFLSHIRIDGEKIPDWFKKSQVVKWLINEQLSQQEFVDALEFLYAEEILTR